MELSFEQVQDVRDAARSRIEEGLAEDDKEVRALRAFLPAARAPTSGRAMVMDTGGTNLRAAILEATPDGFRIAAGPIQKKLDARDNGTSITGMEFFDEQAALIASLKPEANLPLGYCFSYPSTVGEDRDATLIRWTKGIRISGVEGTKVGAQLLEALSFRRKPASRVAVLNDTVASLLAGSSDKSSEPRAHIGLIVGTGTNMAGFFSRDQAPKLPWDEPMAVNLESGNFTPPHLTEHDDAVDRRTDPVGAQRFEKAVSGHYLPLLFAEICPEVEGFDPAKGAGQLVELRESPSANEKARRTAAALLQRSADLVAAGLAAVLEIYRAENRVGIVAEGTLFWGDPLYAPRVRATLARLCPDRPFEILEVPHANLAGSASAALLP